ncbi:MAG: right-handed parallel beta-helix repeat-containing protein, partial [Planctomycetaceae bacterium]
AHSAPRDRFPNNRYLDVRLVDVVCDAPVLFYGPMERLSIQGGRYTALFLGWEYGYSASQTAKPSPLSETSVYLRNVRVGRLDLMAAGARVKLRNVLIDGRGAESHAIRIVDGQQVQLTNCTVTGATTGVELHAGSAATLKDCIVWGNTRGLSCANARLVVDHCCLQGPLPANAKNRGGNLDASPKFVQGPGGKFYLGVGTSASPCIDAGSGLAASTGLDERTTQSDGNRDRGPVDMGFHFAIPHDVRGPQEVPAP